MDSFKHVLSNKNFLYLWCSQLFSQLADRMLVGVLLLQVHHLTDQKIWLALPMISFGLSALIFSSIAGVYVDRWKKKNILLVSNLIRIALLCLFIFVPVICNSLLFTFLISFTIFSIAQFFIPAETSYIPLLIKKKHLTAANSLFMVTWMTTTVFGFILIPILSALNFNEPQMYAVAASFYFIAAIVIALMKYKEKLTNKQHTFYEIYKDLVMGLEFVRRSLPIKITLVNLFLANTVLAILSELAIDFVKHTLQINESNFGYFVSTAGIGMVIGILLLNIKQLKHISRGKLISIGFLISGLSLMMLSINNIMIIQAFLIMLLLGTGNGFITIPIQTIMQSKTPKTIRGRVFGIQNLIVNSAFIAPVIIGGFIADLLGTAAVFYGLGIIIIISGIINLSVSKARRL